MKFSALILRTFGKFLFAIYKLVFLMMKEEITNIFFKCKFMC